MQINLDHTINSGQVFLWEKFDSVWYGINGNDILEVDENDYSLRNRLEVSPDCSNFGASVLF